MVDLEDEIHLLLVNITLYFPLCITFPFFSCSLDDFHLRVQTNKKFYSSKLQVQLSRKKACELHLHGVAFILIVKVHIWLYVNMERQMTQNQKWEQDE